MWFWCLCLATDFALKVADCPETEYPVKTLSTQQGCLWYRKDDKFKIPKGKCLRAFWIARPCFCQLEFIWRQVTRGSVLHLKWSACCQLFHGPFDMFISYNKREAGELRQQRHPADTQVEKWNHWNLLTCEQSVWGQDWAAETGAWEGRSTLIRRDIVSSTEREKYSLDLRQGCKIYCCFQAECHCF